MDWFGRRRRAEERARLEFALIQITARITCLEAVAIGLLSALPSERDGVLEAIRQLVVRMGQMTLPSYLPPEQAQSFRDELSRILQILIETMHDTPDAEPLQSN